LHLNTEFKSSESRITGELFARERGSSELIEIDIWKNGPGIIKWSRDVLVIIRENGCAKLA
jgi:hypothetical protein